ncbi:hypothetical protein [Metabacillus fastidiosus]|uniref:hypothetical protein n=1 Tax=Metabacillus fastidiosus TaxID=1458 RepID=UPI003D265F88
MSNGYLLYEKGYHLDKDLKGENMYSLGNCTVLSFEENHKLGYEKQQRKISVR